MRIARGATRTVIVTRRWAFKLPGRWRDAHEGRWRSFLQGLIANMQEAQWHGLSESLCPVVFALPGGWLTVMPAVDRLATEEELLQIECNDMPEFLVEDRLRDEPTLMDHHGQQLPGELKATSFGWLGEQLVLIDYGD